MKEIKHGAEARQRVIAGIDELANTVKVTLGAKGRNVLLDKGNMPVLTNDGVTIARHIQFKDKFKDMGAKLVRQAAVKTNDAVGDGTTTSTLLAQTMIHTGLKALDEGKNAMAIRRGIEKATVAVVDYLQKSAKKISTKEEIARVASISANDTEIGNLIAEVFEKVGHEGVITVEEAQSTKTDFVTTEGMEFDQGFISPYFINQDSGIKCILDNPAIIICSDKVDSGEELLPLLEKIAQSKQREIMLIAEDVDGEALALLVVNKLQNNIKAVAVRAPGYGERRGEILQDLAVLTGGKVISEITGTKLSQVDISMLGSARKVIVTDEKTVIVEGAGDKEAVNDRVSQIKEQINIAKDNYDKDHLKERLGKLTNGVAVIRVGGTTETEQAERQFRVEDSLSATRAAIEEGVVAGGGVALFRAVRGQFSKFYGELTTDEHIGADILFDSLEAPLRQILANSGKNPEEVKLDVELLLSTNNEKGIDVESGDVVDMFEAGIIDPLKVTRSALENAASVAAGMLTTEAAVANEEEGNAR